MRSQSVLETSFEKKKNFWHLLQLSHTFVSARYCVTSRPTGAEGSVLMKLANVRPPHAPQRSRPQDRHLPFPL